MMAYDPPTMSTEPDTSEGISDIASGHIRLILVHPWFYLDIPLNIINTLCLKPHKYLRFLGWCILGIDGVVAESHSSREDIGPDGDLNEGESYCYVTRGHTGKWSFFPLLLSCLHAKLTIGLTNKDLRHTIDLEVIKQRTNVTSEPTSSRINFRNNLLTRDVCCVFIGSPEEYGSGMHIIPYSRGSDVCSTALLCRLCT